MTVLVVLGIYLREAANSGRTRDGDGRLWY